MLINVALTPIENILALINASNELDSPITVDQIGVGAPVSASGDHGTKNTDLEVTAIEGEGLTGSTFINYNRLNLNQGAQPAVTSYTQGEDETNAQLLERVATTLGLVVSEIEWSIEPNATPGGEPFEAEIKAVDNSLLYNAVVLTINVSKDEVTDLEELIAGEQDGFDPVVGE